MPLPDAIRLGIDQFNRREFFESHESMEDAWAGDNTRLRAFWQGLIQVAIACVHVQRANREGAKDLFAAGLQKMRPFAPDCEGIDVAALIEDAERCSAAIGCPGEPRFPVIRMLP